MNKQDPRLQRTRKNIMDSFMRLIKQKKFSDISISDITKEAEINRSTFYYHFLDKYDLKDKIEREMFTNEVFRPLIHQEEITEETIIVSLQGIIDCHTHLSLQCQRSYEEFKPNLDEELRNKLMELLQSILDKKNGVSEEHITRATFWSWGIYGVALTCIEGKENLNKAVNRLKHIILNK